MFAVLGIVLLVAGATVTFAIDRSVDGVDLPTVGWILMAGGGLSLLVAAIEASGLWSTRSKRMRAERHVSADGREVIEEVRVD
jgi:hypothetical protein